MWYVTLSWYVTRESKKNMSHKQVMELKHANLNLQRDVDNNEQHGLQVWLRADRLTVAEKESNAIVL